MNLATWFKGMCVFVLSSFVTSLTATQLDPANFNFSKAGLLKLGSLALVIGAKSVLLYLKQSPLPDKSNTIPNWNKISSAIVLCAIVPAAMLLGACVSTWESDTYAALAVDKAVIDCAVAGYNHFDGDIQHACFANPDDPANDPHKFYLPQTRNAQQAIEKARQLQVACVEAFQGYAVAKVGKDKSIPLAQKQAAVAAYLTQLPALINAVRALMGNTPAARLSSPDIYNPALAIARLKPAITKFEEVKLGN